jgi:hypothetical protein
VEGLRHWPDHLESSAIQEQANFRVSDLPPFLAKA